MNLQGKTVALVGRMVANSQALGALKTGLEQASATVRTLLGDAKGVLTVTDDQLRAAIVGADMAVVGMGHPENVAGEEFRAAMMCRELGVPYWMYADNPVFTGGVLRRPWFANALSAAAGVFVPKATDADDAKQCMPLLRVIAAGNPTHEDMGRVGLSRKEAQEKYQVQDYERVMLVSFTKDPTLNKQIAAAAICAAGENNKYDWEVFLCMHPGDPSSTVDYAEFTKEDSMPWNVTVNLAISPKAAKVQNEKFAGSDAVPPLSTVAGDMDGDRFILVEATEPLVDIADVIIDPTGSAMTARSAMHRPNHGIRVITVFTPDGLKRAGLTKPEDAEFAKDGTAPTVMINGPTDYQKLAAAIQGDFSICREQQEQLYVVPPKGTAVGKMIAAITEKLERQALVKALFDPGDGPADCGDECGTCGHSHE